MSDLIYLIAGTMPGDGGGVTTTSIRDLGAVGVLILGAWVIVKWSAKRWERIEDERTTDLRARITEQDTIIKQLRAEQSTAHEQIVRLLMILSEVSSSIPDPSLRSRVRDQINSLTRSTTT